LGQEKHPLFLIAGGSRQRVYADGLVVALEVAFDEVAIFEGVLDRVAMVVAWQLDYFVKADRVGLASLLLMDSINHRDKLIVMTPLVVLLAFTPTSVVPSLVHGLNLRLAIVFAKDCPDGLLAGGMACCKVEQLPCHSRFVASEFVDEGLVGCTRDERSDHVHIHDVGKLNALLGKVEDVLTQSFSYFLLAGFEILRVSMAHVRALEIPYEDVLEVYP
jgi:hypothetical protein